MGQMSGRVTALVNRLLAAEGKATANHKRVFRIMKRQGLLLQRHSGRRMGRLHDGKVVVMRSNLRWCSDVFEITSSLWRSALAIGNGHDQCTENGSLPAPAIGSASSDVKLAVSSFASRDLN
jgi:hypothetical protein